MKRILFRSGSKGGVMMKRQDCIIIAFGIIRLKMGAIELMMKKFCFKYGRVFLTGSKNEKYMMPNSANISVDVVSFTNDLIKENSDASKLMYVSFEHDMRFGMQ